MTILSIEEQRMAEAIRRWADAYEKRYQEKGPFTLDRVRAKALMRVVAAIESGKHR